MNKILNFIIALGISLALISPITALAGDCDGNAIIYCGAYSVNELNNKIKEKNELKTFYKIIGINESQFSSLREGTVNSDGTVWVGSTRVASNVFSSGRHKTKNSSKDQRISSEIYWRRPSDSFKSRSLSAFVYLNYDGSFGYAIIKSCGNPVTDASYTAKIKKKPEPVIPTVPSPKPKYSLTVYKFNDQDGDGKKDKNENALDNRIFRLTGNTLNKKLSTNKNGKIVFNNLQNGKYTLIENIPNGWESTTKNPLIISISGKDQTKWVGNRRSVFNITINKFEDLDGDKKKDPNEKMLSGWNFKISNKERTLKGKTNKKGQIYLKNVPRGSYILTETPKAGWKNTTKNNLAVKVGNNDLSIWFGNRKRQNMSSTTVPDTETVNPIVPLTEVKGTNISVATLPGAGAKENMIALILISLFYSSYYYLKSKRTIKKVFQN